jgi:hypothetical protein
MHTYPQLSTEQSSGLPKLTAAPTLIPAKFPDSTHQIWACETTSGPMVLKVCDQEALKKSHFWQGMNHLFAADFPQSLGHAQACYQYLSQYGLFRVPAYMAAQANHFVLTRYVSGSDLAQESITDADVSLLAKHISQLHQQTFSHWGALHKPTFDSNDWRRQLQVSLLKLSSLTTSGIPASLLDNALQQASHIQIDHFVPIMPDLRWDQFRTIDDAATNIIALIDLDAIVIGPAGLELVLIEYLLDKSQYSLFKGTYVQQKPWPDFEAHKPCYQLLLFLMGVLGETDITKWMKQI